MKILRNSEEARRLNSIWHKGRKFSEEHKKNVSLSLIGRKLSEETKIKMGLAHKGKHYHSEEFKQKLREKMRLKEYNPIKAGMDHPMYGRVLPHLLGERNPSKNPEIMKLILEKRLDKWIKSIHRKPNYPEQMLIKILNFFFPNEYKYVGDFKTWIGGKNPDFINVNGQKKVIELFGEAWHPKEDEQKRKDHFSKFGFETLIIWAKELDNIVLLGSKLRKFHND